MRGSSPGTSCVRPQRGSLAYKERVIEGDLHRAAVFLRTRLMTGPHAINASMPSSGRAPAPHCTLFMPRISPAVARPIARQAVWLNEAPMATAVGQMVIQLQHAIAWRPRARVRSPFRMHPIPHRPVEFKHRVPPSGGDVMPCDMSMPHENAGRPRRRRAGDCNPWRPVSSGPAS